MRDPSALLGTFWCTYGAGPSFPPVVLIQSRRVYHSFVWLPRKPWLMEIVCLPFLMDLLFQVNGQAWHARQVIYL
jgi:hypothetical protein